VALPTSFFLIVETLNPQPRGLRSSEQNHAIRYSPDYPSISYHLGAFSLQTVHEYLEDHRWRAKCNSFFESSLTGVSAVTSPPSGRSRPIDRITDAYRLRYASYLASTFHIGLEAAEVEAAHQLQPRRPSETSESEVYRG